MISLNLKSCHESSFFKISLIVKNFDTQGSVSELSNKYLYKYLNYIVPIFDIREKNGLRPKLDFLSCFSPEIQANKIFGTGYYTVSTIFLEYVLYIFA